MEVTFADYPCIDPAVLAQSAGSSAIRDWSWQGLCNSYENQLGVESGEGHILLLRSDLNKFQHGQPYSLVFDDGLKIKTIRNLHIVYGTAVTPGSDDDPNCVYHLRLADPRRIMKQTIFDPISVTYRDRLNVPRTPYADTVAGYQVNSTSGGVFWTWKLAVQRIWESLPSSLIGSFPADDFDEAYVSGTPEGLRYDGWSPLSALGDILARLNMSLQYKEESGTFRIHKLYQSAQDQTIFYRELIRLGGSKKIYQTESIVPGYGRVPRKVAVYFRGRPQPDQGIAKYTVVQITDSTPTTVTGAHPDSVQIIFDDMQAIFDGTTVANSSALNTRAQARADRFWEWAKEFNFPESVTYIGMFPDSIYFTTSSMYSKAWFGQTGQGFLTRLSRSARDCPSALNWMRDPEDQNFDLVEVVEVTTAAIDSNGYFAGVTKELKGSDGTYTTGMNCWLKVENTDLETLVTGTRFIARLSGYRDSKPVYVSEMVLNQITDVPLNVVTKVCWDDQNFPLQVMEGSIGGDFTDADWDLVAWDLGITVERRGISFPEGTYFGSRSCIPQIDCCDSGTTPSPPDYPDGQTGNDPTACCSPAPPSTLYATLAHSSGGYVCLDAQVIELTYNTGLQAWQGNSMTGFSCPEHAITPPSSCTMGVAIAMFCNNADWLMSMSIGNPGSCFFKSNQIAASTACSPFSTLFTMALAECGSQPSPNGCEVAAAPTFTVLVTE